MLLSELFKPQEAEPDFKEILKVFLPVAKKILKLDKMPTIILKKTLSHGDQPTMGRFNNETYSLELAIANRQPVDTLRTLAHELVHAKQDRNHVDIDSATGSPEENEANVHAGIIMREFNKLYPEFLKAKPVSEGGNVFAGKTTSIKREHIQPTLAAYFSELKSVFPKKAAIFSEKNFVPLGSVGKKAVSGDIDLGVSATDLLDKEMSDQSIAAWGLDPAAVAQEFEALKARARSSTPEQLRMKAFLKLLTRYINAHAPTLFCDEKKVT